ncbi:48_t:CDS:1 [Rhizophagus irregularis]|nr:48_t:CDS:1 [Rhizophagus irregularis]
MQNAEILENFEELKKNMAETSLTNGLVIQDLENTIRNLEADVTAKERIILEKSEANNMLWEKIKALETKEENLTSQATNMEIDNKTQKKKKRPTKREKRRDQLLKLERSPTW